MPDASASREHMLLRHYRYMKGGRGVLEMRPPPFTQSVELVTMGLCLGLGDRSSGCLRPFHALGGRWTLREIVAGNV